jgi:hypothetical protein
MLNHSKRFRRPSSSSSAVSAIFRYRRQTHDDPCTSGQRRQRSIYSPAGLSVIVRLYLVLFCSIRYFSKVGLLSMMIPGEPPAGNQHRYVVLVISIRIAKGSDQVFFLQKSADDNPKGPETIKKQSIRGHGNR